MNTLRRNWGESLLSLLIKLSSCYHFGSWIIILSKWENPFRIIVCCGFLRESGIFVVITCYCDFEWLIHVCFWFRFCRSCSDHPVVSTKQWMITTSVSIKCRTDLLIPSRERITVKPGLYFVAMCDGNAIGGNEISGNICHHRGNEQSVAILPNCGNKSGLPPEVWTEMQKWDVWLLN